MHISAMSLGSPLQRRDERRLTVRAVSVLAVQGAEHRKTPACAQELVTSPNHTMNYLREVQRLLTIIEGIAPRACERSSLYRVQAKKVLRGAALLETSRDDGDTVEAREGPQEETQCQELGEASTTDLRSTLTKLLPKRRHATSPSSKAKIRLVRLNQSGPSNRT